MITTRLLYKVYSYSYHDVITKSILTLPDFLNNVRIPPPTNLEIAGKLGEIQYSTYSESFRF